MQRSKNNSLTRTACLLSAAVMALCIAGCGAGTSAGTAAPSQQAPQTYFAPFVAGIFGSQVPQSFIFDEVGIDGMPTFSQETFALNLPGQVGLEVLNAGHFTVGPRGLRSLGILTTDTYSPAEYPASTPKTGSFAVELAGQAGGLVQMVGQPAEPLVAATQCPNFTTAQTYQFISIPSGWDESYSTGPFGGPPLEQGAGFNPLTDTAYGSVDIVSSGSTVTFQSIHQYTLAVPPSAGGTGMPGTPTQPASALPVSGACGPTNLGSVTGVPGQYTVTDPGGSASNAPPQAVIGIGPTGLLVEDNRNGSFGLLPNTSPGLIYENVLGAGTGAVGLPKPLSAVDTNAVTGAQYLGFITAAGIVNPYQPPSSHLVSFGFSSSMPASCAAFAAQTGPLVNGIYGGDYAQTNGQDDPSLSPDGFGNCDFAIDLGVQDPMNNGLYPNATAWVGGGTNGYVSNTTGSTYSFPAVAIAGQLNGKSAIFLIGLDSTQPWIVYLLQSTAP